MNQRGKPKWLKIPSWILVPAVLGALILALVMFGRDYRREQGYLKDMFLGRGEMLIHSLEMVGRVRFGQNWEARHLVDFWNNLEESDNVLFMALTDEQGQLEAVAGGLASPPAPEIFARPESAAYTGGTITPSLRFVKIQGRPICLVYRAFWPMPRPPKAPEIMSHHSSQKHQGTAVEGTIRMRRQQGMGPPMRLAYPNRLVWIAFDLSPFEELHRSRIRTAGLFVGLFCLATLAGVLALFWGHNSRLARRMYQDTNALAAELIGRLPIGMFLVDGSGVITLVNRAAVTISGLTKADCMGRTLAEITAGRFPATGTMTGREMDMEFTGGQAARISITSGPVVSDDGHHLGHVILMEDLGEVGRLKAELAKKERLAALGSLAAGLAHEIRNPLGAIRGLSQHLLNKGPADSRDREALEVMLSSVDRLNATITNFLDYARPAVIRPAPLDLAELVKNMATLAGHDAKARQVDIKLEMPDEPVPIVGDEALLSQAFLNLYLNAIEAAGVNDEDGRLTVLLKLNEQKAVLTFADNGPGFTADQLAQPFVPYFTTKAEGTGLGLAMVEKTIRAHEGAAISLAQAPTGGALVTVVMPLTDTPENQSPPSEG
ncbi:PAS domain-containing protein [Deltaproteobacteria bacterium OttesenSCG-928-M10]|nr:PAS domain-containing protein [Deltaproteobacteria bacterium OttesenSCG-928-M10]